MCCSNVICVNSKYLSMCPSTCSYLILAVVLFLVFLMFLRMSAQLAPGRILLRHFLEMLTAPMQGCMLPPSEVPGGFGAQRGAGAQTLDTCDSFVLLQLRMEEPSRLLSSYVHWFRACMGK